MKKFIFMLSVIIPTVAIAMETEQGNKPTIKMDHEEFSSLLEKKYYSLPDRFSRTFSHTIMIPEEGAHFELSTKKGFHPSSIKLDLEKGTKQITISKDYNQFHITNDANKELATLWVICREQK